jgi:hypothetical protein
MTRSAAFGQAQGAFANQPPHRFACRKAGNACTASEPQNRKAKLQPPLEPAVPQQMARLLKKSSRQPFLAVCLL